MNYFPCACPLCAAASASGDLPDAPLKPVIGKPISGDYRIDALLETAGMRWNAGTPLGTAVEVTYSFMTAEPTYGNGDGGTGFQPFSAAQKAAVREIFAQLSASVNLSFREVADSEDSYGQIRFGNNTQADSAGYAFLPHSDTTDLAGDVWISTEYASKMTPGSYEYATLVHEIGHALGLKHPGNYNAGETTIADPDATYLGRDEDNQNYTVMSYRDAATSEGQQRAGYGLYDMLALQYLYGARSIHTGDADVYRYTDDIGRNIVMVQDSGGTQDTIDLSAVSIGAVVNLQPGALSSAGPAVSGRRAADNLSIMSGTVIENLVGTAASDFITGNAADNRITSGGGNDDIDGAAGIDTVVLGGNWKTWKLATSAGTTTASTPSANVTMSNVERVQFADLTVNLGAPARAKAISAAQLQSIEELYIAYFNRVPDADGLAYWADQLKGGLSITQIGESFYAAAVQYASLTGYSTSMTNADFVRVVYKNVLGRAGENAPADADVDYWAGKLADGSATRGSLVGTMLDSAHSFKGNASWGWVADLLDNKVMVANYFAVDNALNYNSVEDSISKGMALAAAITPTDTAAAIQLIGVPAA